jgi:hypothetical protein
VDFLVRRKIPRTRTKTIATPMVIVFLFIKSIVSQRSDLESSGYILF